MIMGSLGGAETLIDEFGYCGLVLFILGFLLNCVSILNRHLWKLPYFYRKWTVLHHRGFVAPATHNKVIIGCRGLDRDLNESGTKHYIAMLKKMIGVVEQDIIQHLGQPPTTIDRQYCSSDGTTRAPSILA